ncbi:phage holin [Planococcus sp. YIM B11945]|uniref:phage holin n=1 Tax=Planococcus sp. YIM B11945 TaxID=3435410 RepID=UPI003D7EABAA
MKPTVPFDRGMIIRTAVLIIALINQFLVNAGYSPLPFDDAWVETAVTTVLTIAAAIWVWWKDNRVSYQARRNEKYLKDKGLK